MEFLVSGIMNLKGGERKFTKTVSAPSEKAAKELAFSLLGSHNGVSRFAIKISKVEKVA